MKQGVHRLIRKHAVLRQLLIGFRMKLSGKSLQISDPVRTLLLDQGKEPLCQRKRLLVVRRLIVGGQCIDAKRLIVGVLCRIKRCPVIV